MSRIHDSANRTELCGGFQAAAYARFVGDIDVRKSRAASELGLEPRTGHIVQVSDSHARSGINQHARCCFA